jgi:acyl carrier protein
MEVIMILKRLKTIVDEHLIYEGNLTPETRLVEDLGADSFDIPLLIDAAEQEFNILISDQELLKIRTIGDLISLIHKKEEMEG